MMSHSENHAAGVSACQVNGVHGAARQIIGLERGFGTQEETLAASGGEDPPLVSDSPNEFDVVLAQRSAENRMLGYAFGKHESQSEATDVECNDDFSQCGKSLTIRGGSCSSCLMYSAARLVTLFGASAKSILTRPRRYRTSVSSICKLSAIRCVLRSVILWFSMVGVTIAMVKLAGGCVNRASRTGGGV